MTGPLNHKKEEPLRTPPFSTALLRLRVLDWCDQHIADMLVANVQDLSDLTARKILTIQVADPSGRRRKPGQDLALLSCLLLSHSGSPCWFRTFLNLIYIIP